MKTVGIWKHLCFALFRWTFLTYRRTSWWFFGYIKLYRRIYELSANVEYIIWRSKPDIFYSIRPWHFVGTHECFTHPQCVLEDDVILCCLTMEEAVFVQLPCSIRNYTSDRCPFLWITIFEHAVRTITMPLSSLHRLAETDQRVSRFKVRPLLISNSGRCGSTLLAKLIQLSNDRFLVLGEPDPLQCLQEYKNIFMAKYGKRDFLRLLRNVMLLSFKSIDNTDAIVIKVRMSTMRVIKYVLEAAPEIRHIYMQRRDRLKSVQSWDRAFGQSIQAKGFNLICRLGLIKWFVNYWYCAEENQMVIVAAAVKHLKWTMLETMAVLWVDNARAYEQCKAVHEITNIYYEDLMADPMNALQIALRLLKNDENIINGLKQIQPRVLQGLEGDSQEGTPLSKECIRKRRPAVLSSELMNRLNGFLRELDMPSFE